MVSVKYHAVFWLVGGIVCWPCFLLVVLVSVLCLLFVCYVMLVCCCLLMFLSSDDVIFVADLGFYYNIVVGCVCMVVGASVWC